MFDTEVLKSIGSYLKKHNQSVAVAESVTSGLLQTAFSNIPDASQFFQGGITAYNIGQKCRHLLVEPLHAIASNCVSEKIAEDLGKSVCSLFTSHYGIGIVGYAARMPEKDINSLFAYYAIYGNGELLDKGKLRAGKEEGWPAQLHYTEKLLEKFLAVLH